MLLEVFNILNTPPKHEGNFLGGEAGVTPIGAKPSARGRMEASFRADANIASSAIASSCCCAQQDIDSQGGPAGGVSGAAGVVTSTAAGAAAAAGFFLTNGAAAVSTGGVFTKGMTASGSTTSSAMSSAAGAMVMLVSLSIGTEDTVSFRKPLVLSLGGQLSGQAVTSDARSGLLLIPLEPSLGGQPSRLAVTPDARSGLLLAVRKWQAFRVLRVLLPRREGCDLGVWTAAF